MNTIKKILHIIVYGFLGLLGLFILLMIATNLFGDDGSVVQTNDTTEQISDSQRENNLKALEEMKKEQKIKDVLLTNSNIIYASVIDDGTRRDGYADYLCNLVLEYQGKVLRVRVIEFGTKDNTQKDNPYGVVLGESDCKW